MLPEAARIVLHGGTHGNGAATFETVLGGLVAVLVVVGTLYYAGALESSEAAGDEEPDPDSGVGD